MSTKTYKQLADSDALYAAAEKESRAPFVQAEAELSPITKRCLTRAAYVHSELLGVDRGAWVLLNLAALEARWKATGGAWPPDEDEFRMFGFSQYGLEDAQREEWSREFGSNYDRERY